MKSSLWYVKSMKSIINKGSLYELFIFEDCFFGFKVYTLYFYDHLDFIIFIKRVVQSYFFNNNYPNLIVQIYHF